MNPFQNLMQAKSDEELVEIVSHNPEDYQRAALEAAEDELAARNLTHEDLARNTEAIDNRNFLADQKANEPLEWYWWVPAILFPGLFLLVVNLNLKEKGYHRKARQLNRISLYTFGGLILLVTILASF